MKSSALSPHQLFEDTLPNVDEETRALASLQLDCKKKLSSQYEEEEEDLSATPANGSKLKPWFSWIPLLNQSKRVNQQRQMEEEEKQRHKTWLARRNKNKEEKSPKPKPSNRSKNQSDGTEEEDITKKKMSHNNSAKEKWKLKNMENC